MKGIHDEKRLKRLAEVLGNLVARADVIVLGEAVHDELGTVSHPLLAALNLCHIVGAVFLTDIGVVVMGDAQQCEVGIVGNVLGELVNATLGNEVEPLLIICALAGNGVAQVVIEVVAGLAGALAIEILGCT